MTHIEKTATQLIMPHSGTFKIEKLTFSAHPTILREVELSAELAEWFTRFEEGKLWVLELQFLRAMREMPKEAAARVWAAGMKLYFEGV